MKKYFTVLILIIAIIPQVTFAAWWNPTSWFNNWSFSNKEKTEALEQKIVELEKRIENNSNSANTTTVIVDDKKEIKEKKKDPVIDNSALIRAQVEAEKVIKVEQQILLDKQKADEQAKADALKAEADRKALVEANKIKEAQEKAYNKLIKEQEEAEEEAQEKQEKLDAINLKIAKLNAKYVKDSAEIKLNKSGSLAGGMEIDLIRLYETYEDEFNALKAEYEQILYSN